MPVATAPSAGRPVTHRPPRHITRARARRHWFHVAMLAVLAAVALLVILDRPRRVTILADGIEIGLRTRTTDSVRLLRWAGVDLLPGDRLNTVNGRYLTVERATPLLVQIDGRDLLLRTRARTAEKALAEAGVTLNPKDRLFVDGELVNAAAPLRPLLPSVLQGLWAPFPGRVDEEPIRITVRRAVPFHVDEEGLALDAMSSAPTVREALAETGVRLGPGDLVEPDQSTPLAAGMEIRVRHARAVTVLLPDGEQTLYTLQKTVGDAIAEAGLALPEVARIDPPLATPVRDGMLVSVVRISEETDLQKLVLQAGTVYVPDWSLYPGQTRRVPGHDGARYWRYRVTRENGQEAARELIDQWEEEPVDTVVYFSAVTANGDAPPPNLSVQRTMRVYATWYSPSTSGTGRDPSDPWYDRTSTGVPVTYGVVAVDPSVIPYGTRMYIPGYGFGVAADTGGAIVGNIIDLGYPDGVVPTWTSRWVDIYVLW